MEKSDRNGSQSCQSNDGSLVVTSPFCALPLLACAVGFSSTTHR